MARNIRWFVSFKSLNGTTCRVNIYDNDWPEGVTLGLRGAADPFFYEENNSDDLLNDVIRYRTGYIRVIEQTYGQLDAIYPSSTFDRYVEFLYGGTVVFNGYIQVQDFSRTLEYLGEDTNEPCPHVVELPVISPLGLFDKRTFSPITPPTTKTLGQLLDLALSGSTYTKVTLPDITGVGLWMTVSSLVVSPWNEDYHHSMTVAALSKVMKPESRAYLIEAICKAFGWICHDTPTALVFTMFDHQGTYCYYPVGHIGDANYKTAESFGTTAVALTDYYTPADDGAELNTILPDTGIEINYEGELGRIDFSFQRTKYAGIETYPNMTPEDGEIFSICNLSPIDGLYEISAVSYAQFDSDGHLNYGPHCVAWNGFIGLMYVLQSSTADGAELWKIRLYAKRRTGDSWAVKFQGMASSDGTGNYHYAIGGLRDDQKVNDFYVQHTLTVYDDYVEVSFTYHFDNARGFPQLPGYCILFIRDIKFEYIENNELYADYRYMPASDADTIPDTGYPKVTSDVTMPISMYRFNDRMIGDTIRSTKVTEYPYLLQRRLMLSGKFRYEDDIDFIHARMWTYLSRKWRMIAQTFHPWDDEYELTLQHSYILDGAGTYDITADAEYTSLDGYSGTVNAGGAFNHILTPSTGYIINSVAITMGDTDITSTAYNSSTGQISIASVTGNVSIVVEASALPYDAEVNYLQSDGTAYINLGKTLNSDTDVIDIDFRPVTDSSLVCGVFGTRNSATSRNFSILVSSASTIVVDINNGSLDPYRTKTSSSATNIRCFAHAERSNRYIKYDGVQVASSTATSQSFITLLNAFLFKVNGLNDSIPFILYSFQWRRNGDLLFDLIPVRKNGVGYLYDKVSGELFGNIAESGSFSYGDDKTT